MGVFDQPIPAPQVVHDSQSRAPLKIELPEETKTFVAVEASDRPIKSEKEFIENNRTDSLINSIDSLAKPIRINEQGQSGLGFIEEKTKIKTPDPIEVKKDTVNNYLLESKVAEKVKEIVPAKVVPPKTIPKAKEIPKPAVVNPKDVEDCVILIGAFKQNNNRKRLVQTLEKENYKLFKKPFRGLTRIGVFLPCDKKILDKTLVDFKKRFASDAFILKAE